MGEVGAEVGVGEADETPIIEQAVSPNNIIVDKVMKLTIYGHWRIASAMANLVGDHLNIRRNYKST